MDKTTLHFKDRITSHFPNILKMINSSDSFCANLLKEQDKLNDPRIISKVTEYDLGIIHDLVQDHPLNGFLRVKVFVVSKITLTKSSLYVIEPADIDFMDLDAEDDDIERINVRATQQKLIEAMDKNIETGEPVILVVKYDRATINRILSSSSSKLTYPFMPEVIEFES